MYQVEVPTTVCVRHGAPFVFPVTLCNPDARRGRSSGKGLRRLTRGLELRGREGALMTITFGLIIRGVSVETARRTDLNCTSVR